MYFIANRATMIYLESGRERKDGCNKSNTNITADGVSEQGKPGCRKPCSSAATCHFETDPVTVKTATSRPLLLGMAYLTLGKLKIGIGSGSAGNHNLLASSWLQAFLSMEFQKR